MNPFSYVKAWDVEGAVHEISQLPSAKFIAGGTNLIDLMKQRVSSPAHLVDVTRLPMQQITASDDGGLRIGALVTNSEVAYHPEIERRYPLLSQAILAGATPQLRNMATTGGNLLQRTRCYYFYDVATPCNKREPGTGCPARVGFNRIHAIFGASEQCVATHPSDMCVALAALQASVLVRGPRGERRISFADFHRLPGDAPHIDTTLAEDELIVAVDLPAESFSTYVTYLKLRDRASYAFALVSVAAALEIQEGVIVTARLALGGVAHKPWRNAASEALLLGAPLQRASFEKAAEAMVEGAQGLSHNTFKIQLARRAVVRALEQAAGLEASS